MVPSFLAVGQIVGKTTLVATIPQHYAQHVAQKEPIKVLAPPIDIPRYAVKQHWHARYHQEPGNVWLRKVVANLMPDAVQRITPHVGRATTGMTG